MSKETKYGIKNLQSDFPDDAACLEFIFEALHSKECSCGGTYAPLVGRKQYQCSKCRFQIAPCAGTIFHKSDTPLTLWFHAIWIFSNAKSGISSREMERQLNVTYKTAWRILHLIRKALPQSNDKLSGNVEMDSAYFGGRKKGGKYNRDQKQALAAKAVVMGAVERNGRVRALVVPDNTALTHKAFMDAHIAKDPTRLMTDQSNRYNNIAGYFRQAVNHAQKEYARGDVYIATIETFWSHVKTSIRGTHKAISKEHLQSYLDGFVFHYNNRHNDKERFSVLLGTLLLASR